MIDLVPEERAALLLVARAALARALGAPADPPAAPGRLASLRAGVFVSWTVDGERRGSLGAIAPSAPLLEETAAMAVRAALEDPRTPPVTAAELPRARCTVALAAAPEPLDDPGRLDPARQGLSVTHGDHAAVLLPAAAAGQGWGAAEYLKHACLRAGLRADAAALPGTRVLAFEVLEVGDVIGTAG
ncbi:AMMECR1 domain-containing protein [Anaeromyxobacter paludicola]|uniref:AMMECR1 domain-containing protein n=1 Tax=Anaeromyxobacter paludicola TaxID=2918171 RepID=A0ABN6N571_9BACT|nr:AMMECR1 domain-containing protein [Anaeromyxobacter paludicola]BDG08299.1 hypothetical protein AMPC_14120 [Anaeromyxobacter paludicola]